MQRDHPIKSLKLIYSRISPLMTGESLWEWDFTLKGRKLTTWRGFEDKMLIIPIYLLQPLHPSEVFCLCLSIIYNGKHCYPYKKTKFSDVYNGYHIAYMGVVFEGPVYATRKKLNWTELNWTAKKLLKTACNQTGLNQLQLVLPLVWLWTKSSWAIAKGKLSHCLAQGPK